MRHVGSSFILVLGLLAACGKVQTFTDAAELDAPHPDALATGQVTVTTMTRQASNNPGQVQADVDVVVVHPDGTLNDSAQTDAEGNATLDATYGDSVTAVYLEAGDAKLITWVVVAPGDHLVFGDNFGPPQDPLSHLTMTLTWPAVAGATSYEVFYPCSSRTITAPTVTTLIDSYNDCGKSPMDLGYVAYNAAGVIIGWAVQSDVAFASGTTTGPSAWQLPVNWTVGATGMPASINNASIEVTSMLNGGSDFRREVSGVPVGGAIAGSFANARFGDGYLGVATFARSGGFGLQLTGEILPTTATSFNPEQTGMPWFGPLVASTGAQRVAWIVDGDGTYDAAVVVLSWTRFPADGGVEDYDWILLTPPGRNELSLPSFPAALARYAPGRDDYFQNAGLLAIDYGEDADYAALRARPEWEVNPFGGGDIPRLPLKFATDANFGFGRPGTPALLPDLTRAAQ